MQRRLGWAMAVCGFMALHVHAAGSGEELVYIGTFSFKAAGPIEGTAAAPQGIYGARFDAKTGHLSPLGLEVGLQRASWLTVHPSLPIIYSVAQSAGGNADSDSTVIAFALDKDTGKLNPIDQVNANGRDATHMALDPASHTLFVANHGTGSVTALPLRHDGSLGSMTSQQIDYGSGPTPRQKSAAAHGVAVDSTHRYVAVADFGADRVFVYRFDPATRILTPASIPFAQLPPGSGPRRIVFDPRGKFLYLANELSGEISWFRWDGRQGTLQLVQTLSAYPADYSGHKSAAEIALSRDGRYCYLSLRGDREALIVYSVDESSGALTEIQRLSPPGRIPWSFAIDLTGRWLLVADQGSNTVDVLAIDPKSGTLTATDQSLSVPNPVAIAFYRH